MSYDGSTQTSPGSPLASRCGRAARRQPQDVAFDEVVAAAPRYVLDVGCGQGELAERLLRQVPMSSVSTSPSGWSS